MATAVVIGGAGFVGSHLVDRLVGKRWDVVVVDNLATGSWDNLSHHSDTIRRIEHDITEPITDEMRRLESADVVVHMASPASPVQYHRLSIETLRANSIGTEYALQWAMDLGARFVYTSTSETYGDPDVSPQPEEYWGRVNPVGPRSCYDESKRYGEALTMAYWRKYGWDVRIIRLFNCYGPRMQLDDGRVVPNFIKQALSGEPMTVYGDGTQTRSFCFVDDTVEAIYRVLVEGGLAGEILNVGNPLELTILDFARFVAHAAGVSFDVDACPLPENDPTNRCPDIAKATRLLGWQPKMALEDGMERTIRYFRQRMLLSEASR